MGGIFVINRFSEFYPYFYIIVLLYYTLTVIEIDCIIYISGVILPSGPIRGKAVYRGSFCRVISTF